MDPTELIELFEPSIEILKSIGILLLFMSVIRFCNWAEDKSTEQWKRKRDGDFVNNNWRF